MSLNLSTENAGAVLVISLSGRLDGTTSPAFEQGLLGHCAGSQPRIVVECADLEYISSAGLRVILTGAKRARLANGSLVLCGLRENIRQIFEIAGFLSILRVCQTRAEAVALAGE
jgi:anti-anti-sigma factor